MVAALAWGAVLLHGQYQAATQSRLA